MCTSARIITRPDLLLDLKLLKTRILDEFLDLCAVKARLPANRRMRIPGIPEYRNFDLSKSD